MKTRSNFRVASLLMICLLLFARSAGAEAPSEPARIDPLAPIMAEYRNTSLFEHRSRAGWANIPELNRRFVEALKNARSGVPARTPTTEPRIAAIGTELAAKLHEDVYRHPVVGQHDRTLYRRYNGEGRSVGFCFGRAFAAHLTALTPPYRIDKRSIRKIWAIGPMRGDWGHHVATMIESEGGGYLVFDTNYLKPMRAEDWVTKVSATQSDPAKPVMFMATDPERFGPDSARTYTQIELYGPERDRLRDFYRGYFVDFIDEFKNRIGKRKLRMLEDGGIVAPRGGSPAACVDDVLNAIVP